METVTPKFLTALRESHIVVVTATLMPGIGDPTGATPIPVPILGGSITADRTAAVRRTGTLEIPDASTFTDMDLRDLPFGWYVDIRRGVRYGDGTQELVRVGYLRVEAVTQNQAGSSATLELADRMAQVQDTPIRWPTSQNGKKPSYAARDLIYQVFGANIGYHILTTPGSESTLGPATVVDDDRPAAARSLASAVDAELYFDAAGDMVIQPAPETTDPPVWTLDAGPAGVLVDIQDAVDRTGTINAVLVKGLQDQTGKTIRSGQATITDPASPIRYGGPFGAVWMIAENTAIKTNADAARTARSLLNLNAGLARTLTLSSVPNPALAPGDVIDVTFEDRTERHILDGLTIPLEAAAGMQLSSRVQYDGADVARVLGPARPQLVAA